MYSLNKNIFYFWGLIFFPKTFEYCNNFFVICLASKTMEAPNSNVSSTNRECMTKIIVPSIFAPFHLLDRWWCLIFLLRASAMMINKAGERGSPYRRPFVEEKKPFTDPLIMTENQAPEMQSLITYTISCQNPFFEGLEKGNARKLYHKPFACLTW